MKAAPTSSPTTQPSNLRATARWKRTSESSSTSPRAPRACRRRTFAPSEVSHLSSEEQAAEFGHRVDRRLRPFTLVGPTKAPPYENDGDAVRGGPVDVVMAVSDEDR